MESRPLDHKPHHPRGQATAEDGQVADVNQGSVVSVLRVEMRGVVIVKKHLDDDAKERLISGMGGGGTQGRKKILRLLASYSEIQGVWTEINLVAPYKLAR